MSLMRAASLSNELAEILADDAEELENEFTKEEMRVLRKLSTRGREFENAAKKALTEEIRASQKQLLAPGQTVADLVGGADGTPSRGVHSAEAAARERDSQVTLAEAAAVSLDICARVSRDRFIPAHAPPPSG